MRWNQAGKAVGLMLIVLSMLLSACGSNQGAANGTKAETETKTEAKGMVITLKGDPVGFDPQNTTDTISSLINYQIYDRLVTFNENMEIVPQLAKSWTTSEDGKTWAFELNKGITFTDGTPFNAEAVKTSFERVADEGKNLSQHSLVGSFIDNITTNGETEVVFHLKAPQGAFLGNLASVSSSILSPKSIKENEEGIAKSPVGTGPFKLKKFTTGDAVVLEANKDYWGGAPKLSTVTFKNVPETASRVIMLENGESDLMEGVPITEIERLKQNSELVINPIKANRIAYIGFNTTVKPFDQPAVRQALNYAIDKETLVNKLYDGRVTVATSAIASRTIGYSNVGSYPFDMDKAKQMLKDAGVVPGNYTFRLILAANVVQDKPAAEFVQNSLQQLGFNIELQTLELGTYLETLKDPGKYDLFVRGALATTGDADPLFRDALLSTSATNYAHYNNPEVDKLILAGQAQFDPKQRLESYAKVLELVKTDAPWIFLHEDMARYGMSKKVEGITFLPTYVYDLRKAVKN
ncbi:ABC transporter substrate-binding protein [Paenibacillus sabinae]|uniref:ABC transporter substrate-binding protein n=1 Tax=Paenibacillus sabinae T27 TaxID=1268072 RepID=X4ZV83_9BACL|nr:ABC transporter substrate-binding protein [Paenibacillus sabinae]AHV95679.1 ABC transporter substrate-binding protein [Paenibacillus sabinae T27]